MGDRCTAGVGSVGVVVTVLTVLIILMHRNERAGVRGRRWGFVDLFLGLRRRKKVYRTSHYASFMLC